MKIRSVEKLEDRLVLSAIPMSATLPNIATPNDNIPHFGSDYDIVATELPMSDGRWLLSQNVGKLFVPENETVVVVGNALADEILVDGTLVLDSESDVSLQVETILVTSTGILQAHPLQGVSHEIMITDSEFDFARDPAQYGHGIVSLGKLDLKGEDKTDFLRLASELRAGDTQLVLESAPQGWQAGDELIIPDTRQLNSADQTVVLVSTFRGASYRPLNGTPHLERVVVESVTGNVVTLTQPVQYDHLGSSRGHLDHYCHSDFIAQG